MVIGEELWKKLKGYRQELLNLKQVKRVSTNSRYFIYNVTGDDPHSAWLITYKDGNQPIISEVLSYYYTSLTAPSGNQQYIISFSQASAQLTVLSTREVESVVGL